MEVTGHPSISHICLSLTEIVNNNYLLNFRATIFIINTKELSRLTILSRRFLHCSDQLYLFLALLLTGILIFLFQKTKLQSVCKDKKKWKCLVTQVRHIWPLPPCDLSICQIFITTIFIINTIKIPCLFSSMLYILSRRFLHCSDQLYLFP